MAATGAIRLGRDSYQAATVEHIRTRELPGRVLRVAVRAGKRGRLALVSALKPLAAIAERFRIAGTGSAGGVPARHRGAQEPGSEPAHWRSRAGSAARQARCPGPCRDRDWNP
jgi:hypothetical protein